MQKDDWYFVIGLVLALAAFFGVDWQSLKGNASTSKRRRARAIMAVVLIVGSLGLSSFGWYSSSHPNVAAWRSANVETVYAKSFLNETVVLDGKTFDHCHFENVKLLYHGLGPVRFNQSDFKGEVYFGSDNIAINQFMITSSAMDKFGGLIPLHNWVQMDSNGNVLTVQ
jgi:hypothetical protein